MIFTGIVLWLATLGVIVLFMRGAYPRYEETPYLRGSGDRLAVIHSPHCDDCDVTASCGATATTLPDMG